MKRAALLVALAVVALSACGGGSTVTSATATATATRSMTPYERCADLQLQAKSVTQLGQAQVNAVMARARDAGCDFPAPAASPVAKADPRSSQDGIFFEWVEDPECDYGKCTQILLEAVDGACPNGLYVEVNLLDANDIIVGYTNDVLSSLPRGQRGKMTFETYDDSVKKMEITEFNCR